MRFGACAQSETGLTGLDAESIVLQLAGTEERAECRWCNVESSTYDRALSITKEGLMLGNICAEMGSNKYTVSRHLRNARELGDLAAEPKS